VSCLQACQTGIFIRDRALFRGGGHLASRLSNEIMTIMERREASWTAAAPRRFFDKSPEIEFSPTVRRDFNRCMEIPVFRSGQLTSP
jgi:hypothetical protein